MVWAHQRMLQRVVLMWLVFTVVAAPLLCIWYCQVRHTVMSDMEYEAMALHMHSMDMSSVSMTDMSGPTHLSATPSPTPMQPHRPIDDMSQIMLMVTECIIALSLLSIVLIRMGDVAHIAPAVQRVHARRQTPPPRFASS